MNDVIEIGNDWKQRGIVLDEGFDMELSVESGYDIQVEAEYDGQSEVHLIIGDIVEESKAKETEFDFGMEFADTQTSFVFVGPELPDVEVSWSTDAWFRSEGWFRSEAW